MYKTRLRSYNRVKQARLHINKWICLKKRNWPRNFVDPVSNDVLEPPIFKHVSPSGHTTGFTATLLVDYLVNSGNFTHPETRVPFLKCEISRLQRVSQTSINLMEQRSALEIKRKDMLERQSVIEFMENGIKTSMRNILTCVSSLIHSENDVLYLCMWIGLPDLWMQMDQYTSYINDVKQVMELTRDLSETCKSHAKTFPVCEQMCKMVSNILVLRVQNPDQDIVVEIGGEWRQI